MYALKFKPQIFTVKTADGINTYSWELLTVDDEQPANTAYFLKNGDAPSSSASDEIERAINEGEFDVRPATDEEIKNFNIDLSVFIHNKDAHLYVEIINRLKNILSDDDDEPTFCQQTDKLTDDINNFVYPIVHEEKEINIEINFVNCRIKLLNDDFGTILVKWGKYNSEFRELPLQVKAIIADNVLRTKK